MLIKKFISFKHSILSRHKNYAWFLLMSTLLLLCFQNCSGGGFKATEGLFFEEASQLNFDASQFGKLPYPYSESPQYFVQARLKKTLNAGAPNNSKADILLSISHLTPTTEEIDYSVSLKTQSGTVLCNFNSGSLTNRDSTLYFKCLNASVASPLMLSVDVDSASQGQAHYEITQDKML